MVFSLANKRIWVAGYRGMVGGAVVRRLATEGCEVINAGREVIDLTRQTEAALVAEGRGNIRPLL